MMWPRGITCGLVHDGVVAVVESLKGHPLFAHVPLPGSVRSQIEAYITRLRDVPVQVYAS